MNNKDQEFPWIDGFLGKAMRQAETTAGREITALQVELLKQRNPPSYSQHDIFENHKAPDVDPIKWQLLEAITGESAQDWLSRCDQDYYRRIAAELDQTCFICFDMCEVDRKIRWNMHHNDQRRSLFILALRELQIAPPPPIMVSPEVFERTYMGVFRKDPAACKCGTPWESILYGATCAKCGEKRPADPAVTINVTAQPD